MIKKIARKTTLTDRSSIKRDLNYWLSRPPEERVAAVDYLRRQRYGNSHRLQRTARVVHLVTGRIYKESKTDLADIEALGEE